MAMTKRLREGPITTSELDALNDAILVLEMRGHRELANQLINVWIEEFAATEERAA
jgi:hypothetical protein